MLDEVRRLQAATEFEAAARLAHDGAERATRAGEPRTWRRFACQEAGALYNLGRFADAITLSDEVVASATADEDLSPLAHAWNISTIAADRLFRDDTISRLDGALSVAERLLVEQGRVDSLCRTAWTAGTIGLAELGEAIFSEIMDDDGLDALFAPPTLAFMTGQQLVVRNWWALTLEHAGDPRAPEVFQRNVDLVAGLHRRLPLDALPRKTVAVFRAFEGFALTALEQWPEADAALAAAETILPPTTYDIPSSAVTLLCGAARLRATPPDDPAEAAARAAKLVGLAHRTGDRRGEAELLRLLVLLTEASGDQVRASAAEERFTGLVERLDWSRRLQGARLVSVRSASLRRIAEGSRSDPAGSPQRAVLPQRGHPPMR